jgi:hypothetical protein
VILQIYPNHFDRAVECATTGGKNDTCDLYELEQLSKELEEFQSSDSGLMLQGSDDYNDTFRVKMMLDIRHELQQMATEYVEDHHEHTFDMSEIF